MPLKSSPPFPVAEEVNSCYLKKVRYRHGKNDGGIWEGLIFSFLHKDTGAWTSLFISSANRDNYGNDDQFEKQKYNRKVALERILSVYLSPQEMIDWRKELAEKGGDIENRNFKTAAEFIIDTLKEKDYQDVMVNLKTSPKKGGGATIFPFGVFIKRADDRGKVLEYGNWEKERIENLHKL